MDNVILLGPPGAGKGTQSQLILQNFNYTFISTGNILRKVSKNTDNTSLQVKSLLDKGNLIPDDLVNQLVKNELDLASNKKFLFDGFPRTLEQSKYLNKLIQGDSLVLFIEISVDIITNRLLSRKVCPQCNSVYSTKMNFDYCPNCPTVKLVNRSDDNETTITNRINEYNNTIQPILDYYNSHVVKIDGSETSSKIFDQIHNLLYKRK